MIKKQNKTQPSYIKLSLAAQQQDNKLYPKEKENLSFSSSATE